MLFGFFDLSVWGGVAIALLLTHITIVSVTVYLHRHQAHRALDLHPALSHFFRFWLWLTTGMVTREWVAVHRKHHARCESEADPHSPQILGINRILWQGAAVYRKAIRDRQSIEKYGHGTPDDWLDRHLYRKRNWGIGLMLAIDLVLFGVSGLMIWVVQMAWIPFFAAGVINGIGHYWGYRNYEVADASTNIIPWGILIGGEELHNNHHAYGSSAKLSSKWYEFDIGWMYIRLFEILRLAQVKKVAPKLLIYPDKYRIDLDTARAVVAHRFYLMTAYSRHVMLPVLKEEMAHFSYGKALYKRARNWVVRHEALIDAASRQELKALLNMNERLQTVYHFRQQLQGIWSRAWLSQEALLQALQEWCSQAEASGIKALQDFAFTLRGYSLQQRT